MAQYEIYVNHDAAGWVSAVTIDSAVKIAKQWWPNDIVTARKLYLPGKAIRKLN